MPENPKPPELGELIVDVRSLASFIVDLPPGALTHLRFEKEGIAEVLAEITAHQALWGEKAGVTQGDFDAIKTTSERVAQIDVFLGPARKIVEVLEESRALQIDQRERVISTIAGSVDRRAKAQGGADLLAKYEKTRAYRSSVAVKGAKTRKKNAKAAGAQEPQASSDKPVPPSL